MQFIFFVCTDGSADKYEPADDNIEQWGAEMDARGVRSVGEMLVSPAEAMTVKRRGGDVVVSAGPFAETKERIAGFNLIECADMDEAVEIASTHPMARFGQIEIRAVRTFE